ncbi:sel1 repeat family protein, partial [Vibrio anguillarum]|nr:sel1 repeat family protein [Vibrio anguillarum]
FYNQGIADLNHSQRDIEAMKWFKRAANAGHDEAQNIVAMAMLRGNMEEPLNPKGAITWLEKSAAQQNMNALVNLGDIYYSGELVNHDYQKAYRYLNQANMSDPSRSAAYLSALYYNGQGVEVDCDKAWDYYAESVRGEDNKHKRPFIAQCLSTAKQRKAHDKLPTNLYLDISYSHRTVEGCIIRFELSTDKVSDINSVRIELGVTSGEASLGQHLLAFSHFGLPVLDSGEPGLVTFQQSTYQSLFLAQSENCSGLDFKATQATAAIEGHDTDLVKTGLLKVVSSH